MILTDRQRRAMFVRRRENLQTYIDASEKAGKQRKYWNEVESILRRHEVNLDKDSKERILRAKHG